MTQVNLMGCPMVAELAGQKSSGGVDEMGVFRQFPELFSQRSLGPARQIAANHDEYLRTWAGPKGRRNIGIDSLCARGISFF